MALKFEATLISTGGTLVVAIPKAVRENFHLSKGQKIDILVDDDGVRIPLSKQYGKKSKAAAEADRK